MNIPTVGTLSFARLYEDHAPVKVLVNSVVGGNTLNLTIYKGNSDLIHDTRDIDITKNGFKFYDAPIDSKYYYQIIKYHDNGYDAIDVRRGECFMNIDDAFEAEEILSNTNESDYEVVVIKFSKLY
jgi:hypothetical protein